MRGFKLDGLNVTIGFTSRVYIYVTIIYITGTSGSNMLTVYSTIVL